MPLQMRDTAMKRQLEECDAFVDEMLEPAWRDFGYTPWIERLEKEMAGGSEEGESEGTMSPGKPSPPTMQMRTRARGRGKVPQMAGSMTTRPNLSIKPGIAFPSAQKGSDEMETRLEVRCAWPSAT
jgi:hypothetical protein